MSHTPGPLLVSEPSKSGDYALVTKDGRIIAECWRQTSDHQVDDALANAHLFATAEDLLKGCEMGLEAIWYFNPVLRFASEKALAAMAKQGCRIPEIALALRTVIAKAKGESNA